MSEIEDHIVDLLLMEPRMSVNHTYIIGLSIKGRLRVFKSLHGEYDFCLDLKKLCAEGGRWNENVNQDKFDAVKDWLLEQNSEHILTDWLMVGFKSEQDAALFKLFWL